MCDCFFFVGGSGFCDDRVCCFKKTVISSNCPSGPKEFFDNGKNGFLFKNNNIKSLISTFDQFMCADKNKLKIY